MIPRYRLCGGSLISRSAILTAGYCLSTTLSTDLFIGAHTIEDASEQYQLKFSTPQITYLIHPGYIAGQPLNDIAIIKLPDSIGFFNHAVNLVYLPTNPTETFEGTPGIILGYGRDSVLTAETNRLLMGNTDLIASSVCNPSFTTVDATQICSDNSDSGVCVGELQLLLKKLTLSNVFLIFEIFERHKIQFYMIFDLNL